MVKILSGVLMLAAVSVAVAQTGAVPARERAGFTAIREMDLRADLAFLTADALGGRMSLQPGDDAAIAWVASEFAKAGLKPVAMDAAGKPSYLQAMPLVEYRADRKALAVKLPCIAPATRKDSIATVVATKCFSQVVMLYHQSGVSLQSCQRILIN